MQKIIAELSGNCQYIVTDKRNSFLICFGMSCTSKSFVFEKNWKQLFCGCERRKAFRKRKNKDCCAS
jgi:hypothetical protein